MIDRSTIIRGPALVTFNSVSFYSRDDIVATPKINTFKIDSSMHGQVDERLSDVLWEITFTPVGKWAGLATLFPYATPVVGSSVFGATDKNLVIQTLAGQQITYKAAAVTKMPDVVLSAAKTLIGSVTFTAIGANNTEWTDAAKRAVIASVAFSDTSFNPADIKTQAYSVAWGSTSPWNAIKTESGVTLSFNVSMDPVVTDSDGTVDMTLKDVEVTAKFTPVGVSEADLLALLKVQGSGIARGASLGGNKNDLVVTGTGVTVTVYDASPKDGPSKFGQTTLRAGEVSLVPIRKFTAGVGQPLFAVA